MTRFKKTFSLWILFLMVFLLNSCIQEEYDFNKFSTQGRITQAYKLPVAKGSLTLANAVKPREDTLIFNDDGTIKLAFRNDSMFSLKVQDVVTIPDMALQTNTQQVGPLLMQDFTYNGSLSLDDISQNLDPATRSALVALDQTNAPFPAIPAQSAGTFNIPTFSNFTQVNIFTGIISITITNNLPVPVSFSMGLKNQSDNSPVGGDFVFTDIPAGGSQTRTVDISGTVISNNLSYDLKNFSSPGSGGNDVFIDLTDNLNIAFSSQNVRVSGGTAVLPDQLIYADTDFVDVTPDPGIEITYVEMESGDIDYTISSGFGEGVELRVVLPTAKTGSDTVKYFIPLSGNGTDNNLLSLANVHLDLTSDPLQPYNKFPVQMAIFINSSGNQVTFDLSNQFSIDYQIKNIRFGYVEGYFGQQTFNIDPDTLDLNLDDFLKRITGTIKFTNPIISFPYTSTIGIPSNLDLQATGKATDGTSQSLNASIQTIAGMADRTSLPAEGAILFNRDNSSIVDLIAIRPNQIIYSGNLMINPGGNTGARDNFVFGNSKVIAGLEVVLPWVVQIQDLSLRDTMDSPFYASDTSGFSLSDLNYFNFIFYASNGFPLGADFLLIPYNSSTSTVKGAITIPKFISPAPVDGKGKVTGPNETTIKIALDETNLRDLETSDQLIFRVRFNTTPGAPEVVFYTDYSFEFRLAVEAQAELNFDLGN